VGLIVGTGSVAIGMNSDGERTVIGGWGHWFGDRGSGFDLGRRALSAVADAVDGIGGQTTLGREISERVQVDHPREIVRKLGLAADPHQEIAALAPIVIGAAKSGDKVAIALVDDAAAATAELVRATIAKLRLGNDVPLAVAGGIVCSGDFFRDKLLASLKGLGIRPEPVTVVAHPVEGCLIMARDRLLAGAAC
jgi:N-acetylglucosamine kinase-like BadF-type ATPase